MSEEHFESDAELLAAFERDTVKIPKQPEHEEARRLAVQHFYRGTLLNPLEIHEPDCQGCRLEQAEALLSKAEQELADALEAGRALEEQRNVAVREIEKLRLLLLESLGWMEGVEPKPAPPFLASIRDALSADTQREP